MDDHQAAKIGDLEKTKEAHLVVQPKFTADFPEAVVREGAAELTLRRGEEGMLRTLIGTSNVGDSRWGPPLVDEDWHPICQATYQDVEEPEW